MQHQIDHKIMEQQKSRQAFEAALKITLQAMLDNIVKQIEQEPVFTNHPNYQDLEFRKIARGLLLYETIQNYVNKI